MEGLGQREGTQLSLRKRRSTRLAYREKSIPLFLTIHLKPESSMIEPTKDLSLELGVLSPCPECEHRVPLVRAIAADVGEPAEHVLPPEVPARTRLLEPHQHGSRLHRDAQELVDKHEVLRPKHTFHPAEMLSLLPMQPLPQLLCHLFPVRTTPKPEVAASRYNTKLSWLLI